MMDYFVEQAATDQEVQAIIRRKYGDRARILARKEIHTGGILGLFRKRAVEVTGYCSHAPQTRVSGRGSMVEERRKILETVRQGASVTQTPTRRDAPTATVEPQTEGAAGAVGLEAVLSELRSLKEHMGHGAPKPSAGDHQTIVRVRDILEENDFSPAYVRGVVDRLRSECSVEELEREREIDERVVGWIAESIRVYPWQERARRPHVFVLVGPTGVGKTTTIAKLAAMYGAVADPSYDVRILTIDSYRIGALQQIEKYGEIMNIPVHAVETATEMRKLLDLNREADFVFVDTIGKSPNDLAKLAEVNQLVRSAGGEVHLAVSATTKRGDIGEILRQFEPFNYQAVVVTKLDETASVGGIISALHEKQKSVSFITDGQSVPQDIERARVETLITRLRDLPVHRWEREASTKE